ncbi:C-C chemokine receptor type 2-like [Hypanus sabinus]|uniref:C-C chemokine receptor type 2-like n=1 Tax=Hypanus sabinus TaxID=79690 RepID=UPI0028C3795B|nr:C-C chemokine receptor type 2-like [Hypanus sabinus]XP_059801258.1 C-C chemokine receptor type 2-like [Hypanus sabinus]XP_059801259.1 C-C chemokine receptor type 2-like [Hypanus sabinus]XP_059801260.1 C-C chemokine receptor type 2-like [Hypanus sabinus]XP_059801261.1 C-C chemokine receptor type 2-like [Hypanus sabinus]XP_059801262.1 C-C chemokine receptor type 2-like [Hypanus sabinus]
MNVTTEYPDYSDYEFICDKEPVNDFAKQLMPPFYSLVLMLSLLGNGLVLVILVKYEYLKTITNIFILNLAISDLLSAISLPFWAVHHILGWIFGNVMCKIMSAVFNIGFYSGIMFLTLMTIDRYLAVVHAISAVRSRKVRYAAITSTFVWLVSIIATIPEFLFSESMKGDDNKFICDNTYPKSTSVPWILLKNSQQNALFFILPLIIIVYCYFKIIQTIIKCRTVQKHRTLRVIFSIVVVFFLCWAPYNVVIFLRSLEELNILDSQNCDYDKRMDYAYTISHSIAYFHCCLNPIFYAFVGEKFRRHLIYFCGHCIPYSLACPVQISVSRNTNLEGSDGNDTTNNW